MKNDEYWQTIESQPPFLETNDHNYNKCWEWLEKFQQVAGKNLNSRSLIILDALLHEVYNAGKQSQGGKSYG